MMREASAIGAGGRGSIVRRAPVKRARHGPANIPGRRASAAAAGRAGGPSRPSAGRILPIGDTSEPTEPSECFDDRQSRRLQATFHLPTAAAAARDAATDFDRVAR